MRNVITLSVAGAGLGLAVLAQEAVHPPGILRAASQINLELERSTPELGIVAGQSTAVIDTGAGRIVVRRRQAGPNNASVHEDLTEIYHIIDGAGTLVTGGTMTDPANRSAGLTGGAAQRVEAGDWVILPPGTAHWFSEIDGSITYAETRFVVAQ